MKVSSDPLAVDKSLLAVGKSAGFPIESQHLHDLLQDRRLTPTDRNLWLWCFLHAEAGVARPSYDELRPYLSSVPYAASATADTLHRSLMVLRLTGWLCLLPRQRDAANGQVKPSRYCLRHPPLVTEQCLAQDNEFPDLLRTALAHRSKGLQQLGMIALQQWHAVSEQESMPDDLLAHAQHLSQQKWPSITRGMQTSVDVPGSPLVGKSASYVRTLFNTLNTERTVGAEEETASGAVGHGADATLRTPALFQELPWKQRQEARDALMRLPQADTRQAVLDEWDSRCRNSDVRDPAKYLFGLLKRAQSGQFNGSLPQTPTEAGAAVEPLISAAHLPAVLPDAPPCTPESRALAHQHLANIQSLLRPALSRLKPADD